MKLSIVIPSYNMNTKIDQCLASIYAQEADESQFEVIVCDSSDDGSMEQFKKWCTLKSNLKVIHSHKKLTCGIARNLAVSKSSGDYILCLDIDDRLASKDVLKRLLEGLDGKDIYTCSYITRKDKSKVILKPQNISQLTSMPIAIWTKVFKRALWVNQPSYMPEDVWPHFLLVDKCKSFGSFDFAVVDYDNTPENKGAISRTFDWLLMHPCNLLQLADSRELQKLGLREEFIAGIIHNLADMWMHKDDLQQPEVKQVFINRFRREYTNFMSGIYVH